MRIPTTKQIRELESKWISHCDENWGQVLMEIAGRGAAIRALRMWQENPGDVAIVVGLGNNGGDGFVVGRYLTLWGVPVSVWIVSQNKDENEVVEMKTREGQLNKKILESLGVQVRTLVHETLVESDSELSLEPHSDPNIDKIFDGATLIVDALFGTGLERDIEGFYKRVIDAINRSGKRVLSIDIPSGINSDTGQVMGTAVRADQTVTFGYLKPGLVTHPGATLAGDLGIVDIGLPELPEVSPDVNLMTVEIVRDIIPVRPPDSHKGSFGHVVTIAGSVGMGGAAMLSSMSALRTGAGLAYLATPQAVLAGLPAEEVIYKPMPDNEAGTFSFAAYEPLKKLITQAHSIILGPGIGLNKDTIELVSNLISDIDCPCIIDADGLNAIAQKPEIMEDNEGRFVLTPHPKELARLLGCEVAEIQSDRISAAIEAAKKFNAVVVLKGSMTVTANPDGEVFINPTGNAGMATAGAGDVLSGIIGGLLAQRVEPFQAAAAAAYIHGRAGDILAEEIDESGMVAGDIKRVIPFAITSIKAGQRSALEAMFLSDSSD